MLHEKEQPNKRKAALKALKKESEAALLDFIRRRLALPVEKRLNSSASAAPAAGPICEMRTQIAPSRKGIQINEDCNTPRAIINKCYRGGNKAHKDEVEEVRRVLKKCNEIYHALASTLWKKVKS